MLECRLEKRPLPAGKPRRPTLCPGCPHRAAFYAIRQALPGGIYPSDIGCYTLGLNLGAVDTVLCMGAAISQAAGFYHAYRMKGEFPPIVATIGDSTFYHAGNPRPGQCRAQRSKIRPLDPGQFHHGHDRKPADPRAGDRWRTAGEEKPSPSRTWSSQRGERPLGDRPLPSGRDDPGDQRSGPGLPFGRGRGLGHHRPPPLPDESRRRIRSGRPPGWKSPKIASPAGSAFRISNARPSARTRRPAWPESIRPSARGAGCACRCVRRKR